MKRKLTIQGRIILETAKILCSCIAAFGFVLALIICGGVNLILPFAAALVCSVIALAMFLGFGTLALFIDKTIDKFK